MKPAILFVLLALGTAVFCRAQDTQLVANASFELSQARPGAPDDWSCSGNPAIRQQLVQDTGRDGRRCAKLVCAEYAGDGPDFHAMICQVGKVSVRQGQWYRLTFWARGEGIRGGAVEVALTNMRPWENAGLADAFTPPAQWERFELLFRARADVPATASRLQFWFKSTGTLWLDDVTLAESDASLQWLPQIAAEGVTNFVPNSSFECGAANWGSFTWGLGGWAGNLYRLEGVLDATAAQHGQHSLKISLTPKTLPVFHFDYYEPVRQPVRRVLVANQGWFHVKPGEKLTLSAFLKADTEGLIAQLVANEAPEHRLQRQVAVGRVWQRYEFNFAPTQPFLFIAVGLDLEASQRDAGTLWVDAIQLERGDRATAYAPRQPMEAFIETDVTGNLFTNTARGMTFHLRAFNDTDRARTVNGNLLVTDFFDRPAFRSEPAFNVPAHTGTNRALAGVGHGQSGFFRATWTSDSATQSLRCASLEPVGQGAVDSPFGFNHAYPWDFLVRLARQAGIVWWRDWSAKWQTVEPQKGRFDFTVPDEQINRVLGLDSEVEVLLPFPSAAWSTTARKDEVEKAAGQDNYLRARLPLAYAPKDLNDFGNYAAQVVRHYRRSQPRRATHFQILNEPVYTSYALPKQFGYTLDDYLRLLAVAHDAMKAADPQCRVVGGISANLEAGLTRDFVTQGGLQFVDVFDLHMYDPARPAESYVEPFSALEALMRVHGGAKPVWITEWGCYADDDPPCVPPTVGDATMNRCRWPSERAATEHIVKFTAVSFAHGVRKIFFHAGTCGTINGPDAGGVLFEYGGSPRKMYAGIAMLTRLLGVPDECVKKITAGGLQAYIFRVKNRAVAIAWREPGREQTLKLAARVRAYDIMGNELKGRAPVLNSSPLYLLGANADALVETLSP